jgi:nucleotide-binding universal stress UspA family protein
VQRILEIAHSHADTLIVTGARSQAGLAALGSVSERVGARARCSVLVMRDR